ncbi:MAG TPA: isoprenylcysteine carboxylmethyltransferase family protein [Stellaceae bacterium]|nr:isoprenylcysteine carboxylmethyltransferase family protein [Stellaceae bacterium]
MSVLHIVLALVTLQRVSELALARTNTRRLLALGGFEIDRAGYPLFVALHAGWLLSLALLVPPARPPSWPLLGFFGLLQLCRVWVVASLGRRWTTRLIVLPAAPPVRDGPYRFVRHPNYLIVAGEIALLPLAFGAVAIALVFSIANAALLGRRIRLEDRALA